MANFDFAYNFMAPHEWNQKKNFTNIAADPGGPTKWGITLRSWQLQGSLGDLDKDGDVDVDDLKLANEDQARQFYRSRYWIFEKIEDDRLAAKLFDVGVNMGPGTAVRMLQTTLFGLGFSVKVDGLLGPVTIATANRCDSGAILRGICELQRVHYRDWIATKPEREIFRNGLFARADALPTLTKEMNA